jgi:hypothetical protein
MKKLIAIFAVLLFAVPALAADWSFYGSQRVETFYTYDDYGDFNINGVKNGPGFNDDWGLQWNFQTNSRLGARVKADKVTGHIELAMKGTDGGDIDVGTRRAYGVWKFSDNASLKVGKDYSPVTRFLSGQVFDQDAGLLGAGNFYGRRPGGLGLTIGAFEFALLTNALNTGSGVTTIAPPGTDPDWNLPKVEASYMLKLGSFDLRPFGGFQYFKVSDNTSVLTDDLDVYAYVIGIDSMVNIGAFYIGGQIAYGQNWSNANWSGPLVGGTAGSFATLDGLKDVNDCISYTGMLLAGLKFTDTLKFEAGAGYRMDDYSDTVNLDKDDMWNMYVQAVITMAPGVYLIPEAGYIDNMDNVLKDDSGYSYYVGAKWQIDF